MFADVDGVLSLVITVVMAAWAVGFVVGLLTGQREVRKEAMANEAGRWEVRGGDYVFVWRRKP